MKRLVISTIVLALAMPVTAFAQRGGGGGRGGFGGGRGGFGGGHGGFSGGGRGFGGGMSAPRGNFGPRGGFGPRGNFGRPQIGLPQHGLRPFGPGRVQPDFGGRGFDHGFRRFDNRGFRSFDNRRFDGRRFDNRGFRSFDNRGFHGRHFDHHHGDFRFGISPFFGFGVGAPYYYPYYPAYSYPYYVPPAYSAPIYPDSSYQYQQPIYTEPAPAIEEPLPAPTGRLLLEWLPVDAQVFVDGTYAGVPDDFSVARGGGVLEAGTHRIEIDAPGYEPLNFTVNIEPRGTVTYRQQMRRVVPQPTVPKQPATFYLIPGCYMGNVPPQQANLPASCDVTRAVTYRY